MTSELRYIFFSNAEFTRALRELGARCKEDVPTKDIAGVQGIDDKTGAVTLEYAPAGVDTVAREKAAAALILYCRQRNIPLPTVGRKSLKVSQGRIVLVVSIPDRTRKSADLTAESMGSVPES